MTAVLKTATWSRRRAKVAVPDDVAEAVRTLIRWAGDDPDREGLLDTPMRVARAWVSRLTDAGSCVSRWAWS